MALKPLMGQFPVVRPYKNGLYSKLIFSQLGEKDQFNGFPSLSLEHQHVGVDRSFMQIIFLSPHTEMESY